MKLLTAFLKLIRWQNLVFIILTQLLFYFCIYTSLFKTDHPLIPLYLIISASVLIAASGYIINDYFDLNIDQINKPEKNVINSIISRRWAIIWHLLFSIAAITCTIFAVKSAKWYLILANLGCIALLWFYSTSFKRQFLIGNIIIAALTAWTVLIIYYTLVPVKDFIGTNNTDVIKFFRTAFLYAGFAFMITLIREAIKDIEDLKGDARYGCSTLPIVAGISATKIYTAVWTIVLIGALVVLQLYILQFNWWLAIVYCILLIILPLIILLFKLYKAKTTEEFNRLSSITKVIMLTGILSMIFFKVYL